MFQLVFKGERTTEVDEPTARANAMALFKATVAQVERMFSGQRVVIRNQLDEVTAQKYQALLRRHGLVTHVEAMASSSAGSPPAAESAASQTAGSNAAQAVASTGRRVEVEPGDRLQVAGDQVDKILSHSSLSVAQPGVRLSDSQEKPPAHFEHLDEITVAPVGVDLGEQHEVVPLPEPDISHLSLMDEDSDRKG